MIEPGSPAVLDRDALDQAAEAAMAERAVDLQAVWALAAEQRADRRRLTPTRAGAAVSAALAVAAVALLGILAPGLPVVGPQPADVPDGPGRMPSSVGIAPPWTPSIVDSPLSRVSVVVGTDQSAGTDGYPFDLAGRGLVLVGADDGRYRMLPQSSGTDEVAAVSPDGSRVAWAIPSDGHESGAVGLLEVRTGTVRELHLPGGWQRGVWVNALTFSADGRRLMVGGDMYLDRHVTGPGATWQVPVDRLDAPLPCDCELNPTVATMESASSRYEALIPDLNPHLRVVALAGQMVSDFDTTGDPAELVGRHAGVAEPAGRSLAWYRWAVARAWTAIDGYLWIVLLPLAFWAVRWTRRWDPLLAAGFTRLVNAAGSPRVPDPDRSSRRVHRVPVLAASGLVILALVLGVIAVVGHGPPDPAAERVPGKLVLPVSITMPGEDAPAAFEREGEPGVTRVSMVTIANDQVYGLSASSGEWARLTRLPAAAADQMWQVMSMQPLAVSPSGRYVAWAPVSEGGREPYIVIDLETARVRSIGLTFGAQPSSERIRSAGSLAVMDDGSLAVVRGNRALFLVDPKGAPREITSVGKVDAVSAQPGGRVLVWRTSNPEVFGGRLDLVDSGRGRVVAAVLNTGQVNVAAMLGSDGVAWRRDARGEFVLDPVGGPSATEPEPGRAAGSWNAPGGVEALWPGVVGTDRAGVLVGSGWSERGPDSLLRSVPGGHALRPIATFTGDDWPWANLSVAGSVVGEATVVDLPDRPWWSRTGRSVSDWF